VRANFEFSIDFIFDGEPLFAFLVAVTKLSRTLSRLQM